MKFETREAYLLAASEKLKPLFERAKAPLPAVHVSTGWPSTRGLPAKRTALGECWDSAASADGVHQIFISPLMGETEVLEPQGVLATLAHELVHAAVGIKEKHGRVFKRVALAIGLKGKMTSTQAGEELLNELRAIHAMLGSYPHAKLEPTLSGKKKQGTRMVKCSCEACGYTVRTSKKWLEVGPPHCPAHGAMQFDLPAEDEDSDEGEE
jgi:hypothetical protein